LKTDVAAKLQVKMLRAQDKTVNIALIKPDNSDNTAHERNA
jgi:hypothetical protein